MLLEVHEIARADCEKDIVKSIGRMRYKATSTLLQLEDTEVKLARMNEFKQAAEVSARANRQRVLYELSSPRAWLPCCCTCWLAMCCATFADDTRLVSPYARQSRRRNTRS